MNIQLSIPQPDLNPYSNRQHFADVFCACCGRGIMNRETALVTNTVTSQRNGDTMAVTFAPIPPKTDLTVWGRDPVEWASFVGSHCAKQLPKEYKVSNKRLIKAWSKNGCP